MSNVNSQTSQGLVGWWRRGISPEACRKEKE